MPHQQHIWDVALEHDDDGRLVYDEANLSTMRQTSKTTTIFLKQCWRLTMGARMWGPQRSTYTAQKRQSARNKLERDFADVILRSPMAKQSFREVTNVKARPKTPTEWKLSLNNGSEHILFGHGNYLQIDSKTDISGHGDVLDDGNIDEAFADTDDAREVSMRPAQATRWNAQLWVGSTAGDERSKYWYGKVLAGRNQIEAQQAAWAARRKPVPSTVCYFEWSIPDGADIDDEDVWWQHMPALGHTIDASFIRSELVKARRRPDLGGEDLWRRSYGNQWVRTPILTNEGPPAKLPAAEWKRTAICKCVAEPCPHKVTVVPGELSIGFSVTRNGEWSSIGIASGSMSNPYVEVIDHQRGVGWLPGRLVELVLAEKPIKVGCNGGSPASAQVGAILQAFSDAGIAADLLKQLSVAEYKAACGGFFTDVVEVRLRRPGFGQQPLDIAVAEAGERLLGDGFVWDMRNATVPVSPLDAVTVARSLLPTVAPKVRRPMFALT